MRAVVTRVDSASVAIGGKVKSSIGKGFLILLGVHEDDEEKEALKIADKICGLRVFEDENGKTNLSIFDVGGEVLSVSQFTLLADCSHGNRPSFTNAARPDLAEPLYEFFCKELEKYAHTERGIFGADMKVSLLNDGPFTVIIE